MYPYIQTLTVYIRIVDVIYNIVKYVSRNWVYS